MASLEASLSGSTVFSKNLNAVFFFTIFLSSADFFFSKLKFSKNSFKILLECQNNLDPDQA